MDNQRKVTRKNLMAFTPVYGLHPRTLLGYVEDLTTGGTMVIGEKAVEVGRQFKLAIEIPGTADEKTVPRITVEARVAWCKPDKQPNYFNIGFEFTDLQPKDEEVIEAVLRRYEFRRELPVSKID